MMGRNDVFTVQSPLAADVLLFSQVLDFVLIVAISYCCQLFGDNHFNYGFDFGFDYGVYQPSAKTTTMIIQGLLLLYCIMSAIRLVNPSSRREVCSVRMLPHGIQIEEYTLHVNNKGNGQGQEEVGKKSGLNVRFIPREWIIDVIVKEHVMSYRVTSVVLFRIRHNKSMESSQCRTTKNESIKDASLVTAFNPKKVEMSYEECMQAWSGIRDALHLYKTQTSY